MKDLHTLRPAAPCAPTNRAASCSHSHKAEGAPSSQENLCCHCFYHYFLGNANQKHKTQGPVHQSLAYLILWVFHSQPSKRWRNEVAALVSRAQRGAQQAALALTLPIWDRMSVIASPPLAESSCLLWNLFWWIFFRITKRKTVVMLEHVDLPMCHSSTGTMKGAMKDGWARLNYDLIYENTSSKGPKACAGSLKSRKSGGPWWHWLLALLQTLNFFLRADICSMRLLSNRNNKNIEVVL